jgi:four helix bundle suffix protein
MDGQEPLFPAHGGYRKLKSFLIAQLVYDVTARFCERYIEKRSRTRDQMVQAARSGVQNIAEGSQASGTSRKTELKLTNVARASLEELRLDYEDFLRQRGLTTWGNEDPRRRELIQRRCSNVDELARWMREVVARERGDGRDRRHGQGGQDIETKGSSSPAMSSTPSTRSIRPSSYPEIAANSALVLIAVACSLLDRQLAAQAETFRKEGGFTERLYRMRTKSRRG